MPLFFAVTLPATALAWNPCAAAAIAASARVLAPLTTRPAGRSHGQSSSISRRWTVHTARCSPRHHAAIRDVDELNKDFTVRDSCSRTLRSSWEAGGLLPST
ncbi:hypothetical protein ACP4OV_018700 [Aristida adscensionis]